MSAMLNDRATAKKKAGQAAGLAMRAALYFLGASLSFDASLLASAGAGAAAASFGASFAASAAGAAGVVAVSAGLAASLLGAGVAGAGVAGAAAGAGVTGAAGAVVDEPDLLSLQAVTASASDAAIRSVLFIVEIPSIRLGGRRARTVRARCCRRHGGRPDILTDRHRWYRPSEPEHGAGKARLARGPDFLEPLHERPRSVRHVDCRGGAWTVDVEPVHVMARVHDQQRIHRATRLGAGLVHRHARAELTQQIDESRRV